MSANVSTVMKPGIELFPCIREMPSHTSKQRVELPNYLSAVAVASMAAFTELERSRITRSEYLLFQEAVCRMLQTCDNTAEFLRQAYHFNLYVKHLTPERFESRSLTAAFNAHGYTKLIAPQPETYKYPDYTYASKRLKVFAEEDENWDGYGGLPASPEAVKEVEIFLHVVQRKFVRVPSVTMGGDGSVAVVWTGNDFYISADFDGSDGYSYFVSRGDDYICDGVSPSERLDDSLTLYLSKYFTDDQYQNL